MGLRKGQCNNLGGRPKGAINKRSKEYVEEAKRRGLEPLVVMLDVLEYFCNKAKLSTSVEDKEAAMREAVEVASIAAPYCHAKLKNVQVNATVEQQQTVLLGRLTEDELLERLGARKIIEHQAPLKLVHARDDT